MSATVTNIFEYANRDKNVEAILDTLDIFMHRNGETYETVAETMRSKWTSREWAIVAHYASRLEGRIISSPSQQTREAVIAKAEARASRRMMARVLFPSVAKVRSVNPISVEFGS